MLCHLAASPFEHRGLCPVLRGGGAGGLPNPSSFPARHGPCGKQEACDAEKGQSDLQAQLRDARSKRASQLPASVLKPLPWLGTALRSNQTHVANPASSAPCPLLPSHLPSLSTITPGSPASRLFHKGQSHCLGVSVLGSSLHVECFSP